MKRIWISLAACLCLIPALAVADSTGHKPERTLILRVRAVDSVTPTTFSGTYEFDKNSLPIQLNEQRTPFGIKTKASALKASLHQQSGKCELFVEVIEFLDDNEKTCVTKTGSGFEVDAYSSSSSSMSVR
jgi:hypothetical protein